MRIYQKIKKIANDRHVSIAQIERDLKLSNGSIAKWDKHSPKSENIVAVSKYLNVSTDQLLGNKTEKDDDISVIVSGLLRSVIKDKELNNNEKNELKEDFKGYLEFRANMLKNKRRKE